MSLPFREFVNRAAQAHGLLHSALVQPCGQLPKSPVCVPVNIKLCAGAKRVKAAGRAEGHLCCHEGG